MYGCARPVCPAKTKLLNCWNSSPLPSV
jgi:hypothetical protein